MTLLFPMNFLVIYIFLIGVYTFRVRSASVKTKQSHIKYFRTYDPALGAPPEYVIRVGRHYDNQFQVPMLFLITASLCVLLGINTLTAVVLGWMFVVSRLIHTYVHLGSNHIVFRFLSYASGLLVVLGLWGLIVLSHLQK